MQISKMKTSLFSVGLILLISISYPEPGRVFVVDQKNRAADDSGTGTKKQPFRTIGAATDRVKEDLNFEAGGKVIDPGFADWKNLDLRVPENSPLLKLECYPRGEVPGVKLGIMK